MKDVPELFADLTASLEDLHIIAVEGQQSDLPPEMYAALLVFVRDGVRKISRITLEITATLP
jgi:hypothetical protein